MLALIAGHGRLPKVLVDTLETRPLIVSVDGFPPDDVVPDKTFRVEKIGTLLAELGDMGVTEVCLAGSISRPRLDPSELDAATLPLVPRMMQAVQSGDDAALRTVLEFFSEAGFAIKSAQEFVPALLPPKGFLTKATPSEAAQRDAARASEIVAAMGTVDTGQSCVVSAGQALSLEGKFGTDWMLDSLRHRPDGSGGILFKAPKPDQDRRVDLPAIGPGTVSGVLAAGLDGVVIEEDGVMVLDLDDTIAAADEAGVFLWVRAA